MNINNTFKNLIPPLSSEEYGLLKESIIKEGVRDKLLVWNGTLIDGHNRFEICTELGLPYATSEIEFEGEQDAELWILRNQLGRRNLPDVERARIALKLKGAIAAKAKENLKTSTGGVNPQPCPILDKVDTKKEIAKIAGLSHGTIAKVDTVDRTAPEPLKQAMGKILSINKTYEINREVQKLPKEEQEEKAQSYIMQEYERENEELKKRQRIGTKLENMVFNITTNGDLITEEYVGYMLEYQMTAGNWMEKIDRAAELLQKMKDILTEKNQIRRIK